VREVHDTTQAGPWTGLRTSLRPSRGVDEVDLDRDVAIFEWGHKIKRVEPEFIRAMLGVPISAFIPP
jgi:hypothetical protein